jgi:hypothetical protein
VKQLSKKEKKKLEDEEFERALAEVGVVLNNEQELSK